jgi:putrescine:ornithine antiporter
MTISPSLNKQFNVLVDLAVVTNVIPYLLSMAALAVLLKTENVPQQKYKKTENCVDFIPQICII